MRKFISFLLLLFLSVTTALAGDVTFLPSDFSGQGTSGTGSAISATKDGVTFACNKGYGTTEIRCYSGSNISLTSSNNITSISFTFQGGKTGGLDNSYTSLSTTSWQQSLGSQARFSKIVVTYDGEAVFTPDTVMVSIGTTIYSAINSISLNDVVYLGCGSANVELGTVTTIGSSEPGINGRLPLTVCNGTPDNTYAFQTEGEYLYWMNKLGNNGNGLSLNDSITENSSWEVTFNSGNAIIKNKADTSRHLLYNTGTPRFACYTSTQTPVQLYKEIPDDGYRTLFLAKPSKVPSGITVYIAELSGNVVNLTEFTGQYLPDSVGVVLYGTPGTYEFAETQEEVPSVTSDLTNEDVDDAYDYYGLHTGSQGLGFYKFSGSVLPAGKAFLKIAKPQQGSAPERLEISFATDSTYTRLSIFSDDVKTYKYFHNGILYIKQNNNTYNVLGIKVD